MSDERPENGSKYTREQLRAWLDRAPPRRSRPELTFAAWLEWEDSAVETPCRWCDGSGCVMVEGAGKDWGFWFELCRGCS
jgi:hypothetical protein